MIKMRERLFSLLMDIIVLLSSSFKCTYSSSAVIWSDLNATRHVGAVLSVTMMIIVLQTVVLRGLFCKYACI